MGEKWNCILELDNKCGITSGSECGLCDAIKNGADLRVETRFYHDEHIDVKSYNHELIIEISEFEETLLLDNRWTAGIMTLRQPVSLPDGFGPRPSMSFFMYNQNGQQAIARPYLDGGPVTDTLGPSQLDDHTDMPKYHMQDYWDVGTNAVCSNFIYDFEIYRFLVGDYWKEVYSNMADGTVSGGSMEELVHAFTDGCEIKVGIRGVCSDLADEGSKAVDNELFIKLGWCYYYSDSRLFIGATHPLVRVKPGIPVRYMSRGWDFGWFVLRTDGLVSMLIYDPYTLKYRRCSGRYDIRWFTR